MIHQTSDIHRKFKVLKFKKFKVVFFSRQTFSVDCVVHKVAHRWRHVASLLSSQVVTSGGQLVTHSTLKVLKKFLKIKNNNILKIKIIFKNNMSGFLRNDAQSEKIETTIFVLFNVINET